MDTYYEDDHTEYYENPDGCDICGSKHHHTGDCPDAEKDE